ncbi:LysM peptidoglycan-binding domain-containing protein [Pseudarthrobacter phenanthrenivorans]|uniref:LysM peptidoglycan-binding domain-containing protein n=2 Tax=Pseudarthrobacter phenanthrenivorans TaxID=361575 RepID=A0A3B0G667_PSEPS|nr:lytic transglycosylase domain-containing protein [Pseudarthrobacter phenanthrenivorans]ADX72706.1 soluble lytic murein transglycosylase-like protein [Pseudarthrobacter phenanthrenivorans Sphe3]RKO27695.1 LysM peptidoglycan-binding domain-containing protein [Pseudarthrobacter phenanthrenivorans]
MTMSRSHKQPPKPSLPMLAATTAALPAVVLSSLALAQPAAAEQPQRAIPGTLAAAMKAQAAQATAAVIPASSVSTAIPAAFKPTQPQAPAEYTIARGDTISGIAGKFGLNTAEVLKLNNLQPNTIIYPGQKIKLSGSAAAPAAPSAAPAPAAPAPSGGATYTVKPGDTLGAIAARHNVSLANVFSWNNLNMRSIIYPGQKIKVGAGDAAAAPAAAPAGGLASTSAPAAPVPAAPAPAAPASGSYTVKAGDTLSAIASRHGVKLSELLSANRLSMTSVIYPGNKLAIPGAPAQPAAGQPAASVTPLVPSSFLGFSYPAAVVSSANENKALLNASPVPSRAEMRNIVADTARRMGVEPSLALAFAHQESGFDQRAVSPANAIGTMQVIPSSGQWASDLVGRKLNLLDPYDNATAGVAIIRQLLATSKDRDTAIAGYYQGQYSVSKYGMYDDTKAYVAAIKAHQKNFG